MMTQRNAMMRKDLSERIGGRGLLTERGLSCNKKTRLGSDPTLWKDD